jgi:hypothetical protein
MCSVSNAPNAPEKAATASAGHREIRAQGEYGEMERTAAPSLPPPALGGCLPSSGLLPPSPPAEKATARQDQTGD